MLLSLGFALVEKSTGALVVSGIFSLLTTIVFLATLVPTLAVTWRRFQDQDRHGALTVLFLVPYIGIIIVLVFACLEGTAGENSYGEDPKKVAITS